MKMKTTRALTAAAGALLLGAAVWAAAAVDSGDETKGATMNDATISVYSVDRGTMVETRKVTRSDEEWRQRLTPEQYRVTRKEGTERAFTGELWDNHAEGVYRCVACGNDLFLSTTKFESGTGWPSFYEPVNPANVGTKEDRKLFTVRTEVHCARCGSHLGHVFTDGPPPTGLRYCMNSAALEFVPMEVDGK